MEFYFHSTFVGSVHLIRKDFLMNNYLFFIPIKVFRLFSNFGANVIIKTLETHIAVNNETTIPIHSINQNHLIKLTHTKYKITADRNCVI